MMQSFFTDVQRSTQPLLQLTSWVAADKGTRLLGIVLVLLRIIAANAGAVPLSHAQPRLPIRLPSAFLLPDTRNRCLAATPRHTTLCALHTCATFGKPLLHCCRLPFALQADNGTSRQALSML